MRILVGWSDIKAFLKGVVFPLGVVGLLAVAWDEGVLWPLALVIWPYALEAAVLLVIAFGVIGLISWIIVRDP